VAGAVEREGMVPLPPYLGRDAEPDDAERYQTVYAQHAGSVAAPTAGLHFTPSLIEHMRRKGHSFIRVTLHVGPGTFQPVRSERIDEHEMHEEWVHVDAEAAEAIREARSAGRRIVACGTTVVRTLEAVHASRGGLAPHEGMVGMFIRPGHRFAVVDHLVTNFHLPRSTLLALVMALAGRDRILEAYRAAIRENYRFYSYGDAMLIKT
jgi:S-adenosylmethionine:tRNA ribosyltransferase-isomerase